MGHWCVCQPVKSKAQPLFEACSSSMGEIDSRYRKRNPPGIFSVSRNWKWSLYHKKCLPTHNEGVFLVSSGNKSYALKYQFSTSVVNAGAGLGFKKIQQVIPKTTFRYSQ